VDEDNEDLRIIDFGESFHQGAEPERLSQPGPFRVPEIIFGEPFDHRVDLWCAGCVIYSFIFGSIPFGCLGGDVQLVSQMISLLGKLKKKWRPKWKHMQLEDKKSKDLLLEDSDSERSDLEVEEHEMFNKRVHDQKLVPLISVMEGLMKYLPSSRITASQALRLLRESQGQPMVSPVLQTNSQHIRSYPRATVRVVKKSSSL